MARRLSKAYDGRNGDELIAELAGQKATDILEAFWRVQQPELRPRLVPTFAASDELVLTDLLADEVSSPASSDPAYQGVIAALEQHYPPLSPAATQRLVDRLRDPAALTGTSNVGLWVLQAVLAFQFAGGRHHEGCATWSACWRWPARSGC